ncbi:hypothetical protein FSB78_08000 [Sphingomonas ginsenosidivorax]|uniref:Uncharacterized protein n=1 Tax=Sphingomonas ginsenosidivorax TaxID=862135 RepID=A0A5C6UDU5_9SPHN|nr:hypothetical protein [Sphingomonas ginsenosidivorax]TXC70892.1 hypothetical protein FSB78_08000 [Sphingomonas ginsenosidivorax]
MSDEIRSEPGPDDGATTAPDAGGAPTRRALMLGAVTASAVVSIRPALAQTAGSVLNCEIPVPDPGRAGSFIDPQGRVVASGTRGAFRPASRPFKGYEVRQAMASGSTLPGTESDRSRAYVNYIRRLQRGQGGFTCFASLQMPRG